MSPNREFLVIVLTIQLLVSIDATLLSGDSLVKRPSSVGSGGVSAGTFDDPNDGLRKNDDSHLRLFYKSNSPGRTVSHELEHRFIKNPSFQFNQRLSHESNNFQPKYPQQAQPASFDLNNFDPRFYLTTNNNPQMQQPLLNKNNPFVDPNRNNKQQTMLNLHYHGNSLDNSFGTFKVLLLLTF
jgi:hypothetical protein